MTLGSTRAPEMSGSSMGGERRARAGKAGRPGRVFSLARVSGRAAPRLFCRQSAEQTRGEHSAAVGKRQSSRESRARLSCRLLLFTLHDHQVILAELALPEGEQHLDEQAIGRGLIGDDDRLG